MRQFLIVIEKAGSNYSAYSPDLSGCVATGRTRKQAETHMHKAIQMHVAGLVEDGLPMPSAHSSAVYASVETWTPLAKAATGSRKRSDRDTSTDRKRLKA